MGEAEMRRRWTLAVLVVAALVTGACSGAAAGREPVMAETTEPDGMAADAESADLDTADSLEDAAVVDLSEDTRETGGTVLAVTLREGAPEQYLEIRSDEPLVSNSFRDMSGDVVVELPNTVVDPKVGDLAPPSGLVERVTIETDRTGAKPMTRLVIATREDVEHSLLAQGDLVTITFDPGIAPAQPSLAFEPLADDEPEAVLAEDAEDITYDTEPMDDPEPAFQEPAPSEMEMAMATAAPAAAPQSLGTADSPLRGPTPTGVRASRLAGIAVETAGDLTVVEVRGDGEFDYSTFRLSNPERFVIDLAGVVNNAGQPVTAVGSSTLDRVRVAQFKSAPDPVSRVVLDLVDQSRPAVERTPDALVIRLAGNNGMATMATEPAPQRLAQAEPPPEPPAVRQTPPPPVREPEPTPVVREGLPDAADRSTSVDEQRQALEVTNEDAATRGSAPRIEIEQAPSVDPTPGAALSDSPLFEGNVRIGGPATPPNAGEGQSFGAQSLSAEREYVGDPIDMSLRDADVVETLRSFAKISDLNIVIQPDVEGRVTVELENVPWDQALQQILQINGLGYELDGNILRIATLDTLSREAENRQRLAAAQALSVPLATYMKRLSYSNATSIAQILRQSGGVLSQRGSVVVDPRTNTLIIKELPEYMDTVLAIIENLDEPEPQVMIEARIIETTKRFSRQLGIQWGFDGTASAQTGNSTGLVFPNSVDASGGVNLLGSTPGNGLLSLSLGNILDTFQLDATLAAAESDGLISILSSPKVATLNNRTALIQSGLQIPVQTIANNTVTVQFVNSTLRLEVVPQVTADGTVILDIDIQKREVQTAFQVVGATNAPISTKEARTQVLVRDGGTAVIGGIYEVSSDQGEDRVPGLANIPIVGHLFKNRRSSDENEELLIFITPRVVRL